LPGGTTEDHGRLQSRLMFLTSRAHAQPGCGCPTPAHESVSRALLLVLYIKTKTPLLESASELYRQSDRCLSVKIVPTFADRDCHVVSATDPHGR
jgi:hypothetical protein